MSELDRRSIRRPAANEYASYYGTYVDRVDIDGPILEFLDAQRREAQDLLAGIDDERALARYAEGKWSIKEVVGHVIDTERIFAYRGLSFARGEIQPLPGMDQDEYVAGGSFDDRGIRDLANEHSAVRESTIAQFAGFSDQQLRRRGIASECEFTARATVYIIAGHELHHLDVLRGCYGL